MKRAYTATLEQARRELAHLKSERFRIDARINHLENVIHGLSVLIEEPELRPTMGLTEGIKTALKLIFPNGNYPTSVRARLEEAGFKFPGKNPMASIHTVLKRLEKKGLIRSELDRENGKIAYFWNERDAYKLMMSVAGELKDIQVPQSQSEPSVLAKDPSNEKKSYLVTTKRRE